MHSHMDQFIEDATRTESKDFPAITNRFSTQRDVRLLHAAMGLSTESAELLDAFKKHLFYGKHLDIINFREELGDILWYVALALDELDVSFETCARLVIDKLRVRYPERFTEQRAENRNLIAERDALEGKSVNDYFRTIPVGETRVFTDCKGNSAAIIKLSE